MNLSPLPIQKFFGNDGQPLVGGKLFTYLSGTSTKTATYTDSGGLTPNTNPIVLDYRGECRLWIDPQQSYTFVLAPSTDTDPPTAPIWTVNAITAGPVSQDNAATDTGSVNAIALSIPQISSPVAFTRIVFKAANTNTGPVTITINGGTAKNLRYQNTAAFAGGEILAGGIYEAVFGGTQWQLQGPAVAWWRTDAEIAASVTPTNYAYPAGNLFRYGAIGDGSTSDNAAVTTAFSVIQDIIVPFGFTFAIEGNIPVPLGKRQIYGGGCFKKKGSTVQPMFLLADNSDGTQWDGIEFDGTKSLFSFGNAAPAILGYLTFSISITNCYFHDIIDAAIKLRDGAKLHAEGNRFYNISENGIEINNYVNDARTGSPYVGTRPTVEGFHNILGNRFERITRLEDIGTGIVDACGVIFNSVNPSYPVTDVTITGNNFIDCLRHIWTENNTAGCEAKNITVTGNTLTGNVYGTGALSYGKAGIGFIGVKGGVISGNVLRNIGNYDAVGSDTSGITLSASYGTTTNERITVANNIIIDDTGGSLRTKYGITLTVGTLCSVFGNQISGMRTSPMSIGANFTLSSIYGNPGASDAYSWGQIVSLVFSRQNVPANTATIDTYPFGYSDDNEIVIPCSGTLVGISAKVNTTITAGTITITPYSDGTARTNLEITQADFSSNVATKKIASSSGVAVSAGSRFKVNVATNAAFLPTTLDVQITLFVDIGANV